MPDITKPIKPEAVRKAVNILWAWLMFLCLSGIYQGSTAGPQIQSAMAGYGLDLNISNHDIFLSVAGSYAFIALTMISVIIKTGRGRKWARVTLVLSFLFDLLMNVAWPPDGIIEYILTAIDLSLQAYALWLLYTPPAREWFRQKRYVKL